jgi:hypothetical protein
VGNGEDVQGLANCLDPHYYLHRWRTRFGAKNARKTHQTWTSAPKTVLPGDRKWTCLEQELRDSTSSAVDDVLLISTVRSASTLVKELACLTHCQTNELALRVCAATRTGASEALEGAENGSGAYIGRAKRLTIARQFVSILGLLELSIGVHVMRLA